MGENQKGEGIYGEISLGSSQRKGRAFQAQGFPKAGALVPLKQIAIIEG